MHTINPTPEKRYPNTAIESKAVIKNMFFIFYPYLEGGTNVLIRGDIFTLSSFVVSLDLT